MDVTLDGGEHDEGAWVVEGAGADEATGRESPDIALAIACEGKGKGNIFAKKCAADETREGFHGGTNEAEV
jgi:hypothetical protein